MSVVEQCSNCHNFTFVINSLFALGKIMTTSDPTGKANDFGQYSNRFKLSIITFYGQWFIRICTNNDDQI